jgi:acetyl esterase/lipase
MKTIHLVRPELQAFVRDNPIPQMTAERLAMIRIAPTFLYLPPPEAPVTVEERMIPGPYGQQLRLLVYRPIGSGGPLPAILHIHGGGMVVGEPEMNDAENRLLCAALPAVIVSVDYRLAPEHPNPAPLEDCYSALTWLNSQADALGADAAHIVIKGESAGGGIAAGLASSNFRSPQRLRLARG